MWTPANGRALIGLFLVRNSYRASRPQRDNLLIAQSEQATIDLMIMLAELRRGALRSDRRLAHFRKRARQREFAAETRVIDGDEIIARFQLRIVGDIGGIRHRRAKQPPLQDILPQLFFGL